MRGRRGGPAAIGLGLLVPLLLVWLAVAGTSSDGRGGATADAPRTRSGQPAPPPALGRPSQSAPPAEAPAPPGDVAMAPPPEIFDAPPAAATPPPAAIRQARFDNVQPSGGTWAVMI